MDHNRDNPLKRFTAFWLAFGMILIFAVACIILRPLTHANHTSAYEMKEKERLKVRAEIERTQAVDEAKLAEAAAEITTSLGKKPTPGAMPVPGSASAP